MRRLIRFIINTVVAVVCFAAITAVLMVIDGLNDEGDHADAALVVGHVDAARNEAELERAAKLYHAGDFPKIIISVPSAYPSFETQAVMMRSLQAKRVPAGAIIQDSGAAGTAEMARDVAELTKQQRFASVMIVGDYYALTRIKFALLHAGVTNITKSHVGEAGFGDAPSIGWEVCAFYVYLFRTFIMPATEQLKNEATDAAHKATQAADKAKQSLNKNLDTLPK